MQVWAVSGADQTTPWHSAAAEGHLGVLQHLVAAGKEGALSNTFDPTKKALNQQDLKHRTPLMLACKGGHAPCVELLLQQGADPFAMDCTGATALHYAAQAPNSGPTQVGMMRVGVGSTHESGSFHTPLLAM